MKRIISMLTLLALLFTMSVSSFANNQTLDGVLITGTSKELTVSEGVNLKIEDMSKSTVKGILTGTIKGNFVGTYVSNEKGVDFYEGYILTDGSKKSTTIVVNNNGISLAYISENGTPVSITFSFKENSNTLEKRLQLTAKTAESSNLELKEDIVMLEPMFSTRSAGQTKTKSIYYKPDVPFPLNWVIATGVIDVTMYYHTDPDPNIKFGVDYFYGHITGVTGFDHVKVTNSNEPGGVLCGTGDQNGGRITKWNMYGIEANESGSYYLEATCSYTVMIENIPTIFWSSKESRISY